ncbi:hypothetical protein [Sulfurimonas sp.]|uniref:hypothetical protein n=1 Tax=Sulfurimonas sp. TaxID=2022749 RepID=UPI002628E3CD|nr:hypothetical protein [Sulfurimonas sp.]MCW8896314.1 hypothetical protein [Sulfurimonas sp.]
MIVLHILSVVILYKISQKYVKSQRNINWLILLFVLLPGVMSSALIVNSAGLVLFGLLLFVYIYDNFSIKFIYPLLVAYLFIDGGFVYLFLALIVYSLYKKDKTFFIFNLVLFLISLSLFGIDTHGSPRGHFLDSIGIYAAIFTPIIFIYIIYVLYRRYLTKDIDMIWFISTVVFVFSLLLSFRQRVNIEYFAPYLILALPLIAQTFEHSYRVRLNIFRKKYKVVFIVALTLLLINSSVVFFNKYLYYVVDQPRKHFSYKMHVAKELAAELKARDINCISSDAKMTQRLEFYGVTKCNKYALEENTLESENLNGVTISYKNRLVYSANVTKLNIN